MDGIGSRPSLRSLSNSQENEHSSNQTSNSLSFMVQGPDLSNRLSMSTPQNARSQHTNSVSLIVTTASGTSTSNPDGTTITHRIGNKLHCDVTVFGLSLQGIFIRIPLTRSVKRSAPTMGLRQCLNLSFELRGAETSKIREFACQYCKSKISRDLGPLSCVDFIQKQDIIALENGKARISFRFTCYPSHADDGTDVTTDKEYLIQAVLKDELQVEIARYEIPKRFEILHNANVPTVDQLHSHDLQVCPGICDTPSLGTGSFTTQQLSNVPNPTPFMGIVSNTPIRYEEDITRGVVDPTEETLRTISPPQQHGKTDRAYPRQLGSVPVPIHDAEVTSATGPIIRTILSGSLSSSSATILPSTARPSNGSNGVLLSSSQRGITQESNPCAEYVAPGKGPLSGGVEVTIVGTNFPHTLPLRVYFNTKLALVTRKTRETIRCVVPAASSPGTVDVRILVEPPGSPPEVDCKMARFTYKDERMTELIVHVRYIASRRARALREMTTNPMQQAAEPSVHQASRDLEHDASKGLQPLDHGQFEEIAIQILSSYSTYYEWRKAVSLPNEYGQTLAHLAVTLGYTRLLEKLISWEIDLAVRDATGATALHFAFLYDHPDCVSLLTRNGADHQVCNELDEGDVSFNGTLESSRLTSECARSTADREEALGAGRDLGPKRLEKPKFDPRQSECGTNSLRLGGVDLNPESPTRGTGVVEVQPPGATSTRSIGSLNRRHTISLAHPETSYSYTNATKSSLWSSSYLDTLSASVSDTSITSRASWLQNETPTSAQMEDPDRTTGDTHLKVDPSQGDSIPHQTPTPPSADMSYPRDEGYTIQERKNLERDASIYPAELAPQGSHRRILRFEHPPPTGTPNLAPSVPLITPTPITSPEREAALAATAASPKPFGDSLQSLLGISQGYPLDPPGSYPIDLIHGGLIAPKPPPPESYEFREMTLGCRFIATDQWLTTRVDTSWSVSQVKLHMLTKLFGARRDQLKALNRPSESQTENVPPASIREHKIIATSNQSSIVFEIHESSDRDSLSHSPYHSSQPSPRPLEHEPFNTNSDIPSLSSFIQSVPTVHRARFNPKTDAGKSLNTERHFPYHGFVAATTPPAVTNLNTNKVNEVNKEDLLDELLDRLETDAKEGVHRAADKYCLTSFLYGNILDDRMTLGECRLRPFELLEMQEKSRFLQIPRHVYLEPYWESPIEVHTYDRSELQVVEGIKKLVGIEREEKAREELQREFVAEFMSNPVDETREELGSAGALILPWKNTLEARAKEHETRRRRLLQKAEQEETKRQKREIKETAMERWMERLAIVQGHQLNVWKSRDDHHPEQSWDLRRVVEVSGPRKQAVFPPGSVAAAYAALKNSSALKIIRVETKQKGDMEEESKAKQLHHELHIQFSIPVSSANEALDPAGAAEKLKREFKKIFKPSGHGRSASLSGLPFKSSDPFNQSPGTTTPKGTDSATVILRLPDERSLENLSRIIHRSAGKYPLNQKRRRAQGVTHRGAVGATAGTTMRRETKFNPYPEWRERMLQKCIASGRYRLVTPPARKSVDGRVYELPGELQELCGNEEEQSEPESLMSDAEWEGWRRELESADNTEPSFVTESDGLLPSRRRKNTPILGRGKVLEGIIKRTTEHPVHPDSLLRGRPHGTLTPPPITSSASVGMDMMGSSGGGLSPAAFRPSSPHHSAPISPLRSLLVQNHARSATIATFSAASKPSSHNTHDASHDLASPLPNLPDAPEDRQLPGLGGGLSPPHRSYHTVTTISALQSADNEAPLKKGMARVWSNKGKRRDKTEDNPTGEEAAVESPPLVDQPNDTWSRSHNEGLDRLRHMSPSGLRQSGSKGGLLKSFGLRDR